MNKEEIKERTAVCPVCGNDHLVDVEACWAAFAATSCDDTHEHFTTQRDAIINTKREASFIPGTYRILCPNCRTIWEDASDLLSGKNKVKDSSDLADGILARTAYPVIEEDDWESTHTCKLATTPCCGKEALFLYRLGFMSRKIKSLYSYDGKEWNAEAEKEPYEFLPGKKSYWVCGQCLQRWDDLDALRAAYHPADDTVKVAHIADSHLRQSQYGSKRRGQAFFLGLMSAVKKAVEAGADAIIHSGDLLDGARPSARDLLDVKKLHEYLIENNIAMYHISGNHDDVPGETDKAYKQSWMQVFSPLSDGNGGWYGIVDLCQYEPCPITGPERCRLSTAGGDVCYGMTRTNPVVPNVHRIKIAGKAKELVIAAYPWCSALDFRNQLGILERVQDKGNKLVCGKSFTGGLVDIVMWHGAVREFCNFPVDTALGMDELPTGITPLYALGDIHVHKTLELSDKTLVAYPGSTCMCACDEEQQKQFYMYTFRAGVPGVVQESVPFDTAPIITLEVKTEQDVEEVMAEISRRCYVCASMPLPYGHAVIQAKIYPCAPENASQKISHTLDKFVTLGVVYRCIMMPREEDMAKLAENRATDLSLLDFTPGFVKEYSALQQADESLADLCSDLVNPGHDAENVLEKYNPENNG